MRFHLHNAQAGYRTQLNWRDKPELSIWTSPRSALARAKTNFPVAGGTVAAFPRGSGQASASVSSANGYGRSDRRVLRWCLWRSNYKGDCTEQYHVQLRGRDVRDTGCNGHVHAPRGAKGFQDPPTSRRSRIVLEHKTLRHLRKYDRLGSRFWRA